MTNLRKLRKNNNLSMKELGAILGLSESTISLYENHKREPDINTLLKIADFFKVSVDELLDHNTSNQETTLDLGERKVVREVHSPVMLNFEKMCSELDENTLDRIHTILYSIRRIQNNNQIDMENKQYIFACLAELIGRVELYSDNFQSSDLNYVDLAEYNKRFINAEVDVLQDIIKTLSSKQVSVEKKTKNKKQIVIPLYLTPASAGTGSWLDDDTPTEWITVPKSEKTVLADFLIKVRGDSMQPKYYDGDIVLVKQSNSITEGEYGVFILNNEAFIKKMGKGELISLNPDYDNIAVSDYDTISCAGKVIGVLESE